jgi:hypothetical protein
MAAGPLGHILQSHVDRRADGRHRVDSRERPAVLTHVRDAQGSRRRLLDAHERCAHGLGHRGVEARGVVSRGRTLDRDNRSAADVLGTTARLFRLVAGRQLDSADLGNPRRRAKRTRALRRRNVRNRHDGLDKLR